MKMRLGILALMMALCGSAFGQKFGHVYAEVIMQELPQYKTVTETIKKRTESAKKQIADFEKQIQEKYEECNAPNLSEDDRKFCAGDLQELQTRAQQRSVTLEQEIQSYSQEKQVELTTLIQDAIKKVAKAGAYTYVFDANVMYSIEGGEDLTDAVRKELGLSAVNTSN